MCQLLETIKLEKGKFSNIKYHNLRFNRSRQNLFGISETIKLEEQIHIPTEYKKGLYRCRIIYSPEIETIEFIPYQLKTVKSLKIITDNTINYSYKYANRKQLNKLFKLRKNCDEIIIIKNGLVTDCSIGNLIFFDGQKWTTPSTPLLNGTKRMQLLNDDLITEEVITAKNLSSYKKAGIINAFSGIKNSQKIPISSIVF